MRKAFIVAALALAPLVVMSGVQAHQLERADDAYRQQGDAMPGADRTYYVKVELDATTCTACLKDRSSEIPDFEPVK